MSLPSLPSARQQRIAAYVLIAIVALVLLSALAVAFGRCGGEKPNIPPATQRSNDSLSITKPTFDSSQVAGRQQIARDTSRGVTQRANFVRAATSATASKATADSLAAVARRADSIAGAARLADSLANAWRAVAEARAREAEQWHLAATSSDSAYQVERSARIAAVQLWVADTLRRHAVEKVNAELVTAIGNLQQPCKVAGTFGLIPCPSRTVSAIGGAVITIATVAAVRTLKP